MAPEILLAAGLAAVVAAPLPAGRATVAACPHSGLVAAGACPPSGTAAVLAFLSGGLVAIILCYRLALQRTARHSAVTIPALALAAAFCAPARDGGPRLATGVAVVVAAGAALVWSLGRAHRRFRARRVAVRDRTDNADALLALATAVERRRLAAELHDLAAHRMTEVAVTAAAALRTAGPPGGAGPPAVIRAATAGPHGDVLARAEAAGRLAVTELDRLAAGPEHRTEVDLRALAGRHDFGRTGGPLTGEQAVLACRLVREAMTNVARYAAGARVTVLVDTRGGGLTVRVTDSGGEAAGRGLGAGTGLAGLDAAVRATGGTLHAGPHRTGWQLHARIPPAGAATPARRDGPRLTDWALVLLGAGISLGVVLLPDASDPDLLAAPGRALTLLLPLTVHAAALAWRHAAPVTAFGAAVTVLAAWTGACLGGWTGLEPAGVFLGTWWIELLLLYRVGARGRRVPADDAGGRVVHSGRLPAFSDGSRTRTAARGWRVPAFSDGSGVRAAARGWWAPVIVAAVGGIALAGGAGIHGNRAGAAAVLGLLVLMPATAVWAAGRATAGARDRRLRERRRERDRLARLTRSRIAAQLRGDARRHAQGVVTAARSGSLGEVRAQARAALTALRDLLHDPAPPASEPPPGLAALHDLAVRRRLTLTVGELLLPAEVEVAAYRAVTAVVRDGATVRLEHLPGRLRIRVDGARTGDPAAVRALREVTDTVDGTARVDDDRVTVSIWTP